MQQADRITRAVAGFVDLLLVLVLARLPDVLGTAAATGYLLIRDGLFEGRSIGKKLVGLRIAASEESAPAITFRESIIRNATFALAYLLFLIPYAGWILALLVVGIECLAAVGDERGMRIGDLLARTVVVSGAAETPPVPPEQAAPEPDGPGEEQELRLP